MNIKSKFFKPNKMKFCEEHEYMFDEILYPNGCPICAEKIKQEKLKK